MRSLRCDSHTSATERVRLTSGSSRRSALQEVLQKLKRQRVHPTILQAHPAYDLQANGAVEKAAQEYMGQLRTMKVGLEARLQFQIEPEWAVLQWMSELAPELMKTVPGRTRR